MALDRIKLIDDLKTAMLLGIPEDLSEKDNKILRDFIQLKAEGIANAIHNYTKSAEVKVNKDIPVGDSIKLFRYKTTEDGNGYLV